MLIARITGATRHLGKPEGWEDNTDLPCQTLAIRDEVQGGLEVMVSAWEPTPEELAMLKCGAKVYLTIVGNSHPPVALTVA